MLPSPCCAGWANDNAQKEFYLPDCVALARGDGERVALVEVAEEEALGENDRVQLATCEGVLQARLREAHLRNGVTMIARTLCFWRSTRRLAAMC